MKYGEQGEGAIGYLVGEENRGLNVMFIMMNAARLAVGMQGVAVAERATQRAVSYARQRRQGRSASSVGSEMAPIIEHADIRRSLMTMKALTQAARAICLVTARETDVARRAQEAAERVAAGHRVALLTPLPRPLRPTSAARWPRSACRSTAAWASSRKPAPPSTIATPASCRFTKAPTASRPWTWSRRKLALEGGKVVTDYIANLNRTVEEVRASNRPEFGRMAERLGQAVAALGEATRWIGDTLPQDPDSAMAVAVPYLRLFGLAAAAPTWQRARWPPAARVPPTATPAPHRPYPWRAFLPRRWPPPRRGSRTVSSMVLAPP